MKEKVIDFGNEKVSVLFKKLFFPTISTSPSCTS